MREIKIKAVLNGFMVDVGCQRVVFTDIAMMLHELEVYLKNPDLVEQKYLTNSINRMHIPMPADCREQVPMPEQVRSPERSRTIGDMIRAEREMNIASGTTTQEAQRRL